jgi:hypothetical protein
LSAGCATSELDIITKFPSLTLQCGSAGLVDGAGYPVRIWGVGFCVVRFYM